MLSLAISVAPFLRHSSIFRASGAFALSGYTVMYYCALDTQLFIRPVRTPHRENRTDSMRVITMAAWL